MKRVLVAIMSAALTAGCATQAKMDAEPFQRSTFINENYQRVYSNVNRGARNCSIGVVSVDGQLFSELGYGEVDMAARNMTNVVPMLNIRIVREGRGSSVQSKSLMSAARVRSLDWVDYWARGGMTCPKVSYGEAPPS